MRSIIQRVLSASIHVDGNMVAQIEKGFLVFTGFTHGDGESQIDYTVKKILSLRILEDENGKVNHSLGDLGGGILVVPQFTLYADSQKGNRPSFTNAATPDIARGLFHLFLEKIKVHAESLPIPPVVRNGIFGADMKVSLVNDGPFTIILDSPEKRKVFDPIIPRKYRTRL